jgi:RimJ/RimL family protein N-acetyltransferase
VELLRTERLVLRHWRETDLDAFFDLYSRDEVSRWLGPQPRRALMSAGEARERLALWCGLEAKLEPPVGLWAMVPLGPGAAEGQPVGTTLLLSLADADGPTGLTEVGWHLHPQYQGRGLATEGAAAILDAAAAAGIGQVLALTDLDNGPSQAVAVRLGMTDAGTTDRWFGLTMREFRKDLSRA